MYVTWDPEDGSPKVEFEFSPEDDLMSKEAADIEAVYRQPIEMWMNGLRAKEATARRLLLWWYLRQTHPRLPFKDVPDFRMRQMKVEMNVLELQALWKEIARTVKDEERQEQLRVAFEISIQDAYEREGKSVEGEIVLASGETLPKEA